MSGVLGCLLVAAAMLVRAEPAVASSHSEFTPIADSYVQSSNPGSNYGTLTTVRTDASPERNAYLKFEVQGEGDCLSAVLRVFTESNNTTGFEVRTVTDSTWDESNLTYNNAPPLGPVIATSGPVSAGTFADVDVSAAVSGDGLVTLALTSVSSTSTSYSSREGANAPTLFIPGPPSPSPFSVTRTGSTYQAESASTGQTYSGSLKYVVEAAANELSQTGGGVVTFGTGIFDFGSDHFEFYDLVGVTFAGQGIDETVLRNSTSAATDTEPFDFSNSVQITVRDMTVFAGGSPRSTSDALDFDGGDDVVVERVKVTGSRGRGIVFDGKETSGSGTANRNTIRDCLISGIPGDGIELLASSDNLVENCTITDVGGHGIQINKASTAAQQPNKQSTNNTIQNNTVTNSGQDGINVNSGNDNRFLNNTITNSSDDTNGRDGIRLSSFNGVACDDNVVTGNVATDNQPVKTQKYGLNIQSANCNDTIIGAGNDFSGNLTGDINDNGTNTQYPNDTQAPTAPANLSATSVEFNRVVLAWDAATDNNGVDLYRVYRNGSAIGTVGGGTLIFTDNTVAPESSYTYEVEARGRGGQRLAAIQRSGRRHARGLVVVHRCAGGRCLCERCEPGSNYGTSSQLRTDASPVIRSYLRFIVSGVSGTPTSARLRLRADVEPQHRVRGAPSERQLVGGDRDHVCELAADGRPAGKLGAVDLGYLG